ncbi:MAG: cobalamin-dependent protein, partial [Clostridiales bacterium]|nr:cobalamin-dependent protein [Clostridiales bacterium]
MKIILCAVNSQYIQSNPAIYSLARALEGLPRQPQLLLREYSLNLPAETILRELYGERPDVLAFSMYIWNNAHICRLAADLGKLLPQTTMLAGGPEATPNAAPLLAACPALHGVILGEGELIWPQLIGRMLAGESRPVLPGLLWRGMDAAQAAAAPAPDLAALPFLYSEADLNDLAAMRKILYYESSRG